MFSEKVAQSHIHDHGSILYILYTLIWLLYLGRVIQDSPGTH